MISKSSAAQRLVIYVLALTSLTTLPAGNPPSMGPHQLGAAIREIYERGSSRMFPFLWGASTSGHQNSGRWCTPDSCSHSRMVAQKNDALLASAGKRPPTLMPSPADAEYPADLRTHYRAYIDQAAAAGLNSLRFSIEWPQVQPEGPDIFDEAALDHYADMFICLLEHNMTPVLVFHHYTDPCWFIDAGGFERPVNITRYFVPFCVRVYTHIMERVADHPIACALGMEHEECQTRRRIVRPLWATFNSPEGYAFKCYYTGDFPPSATDPSRKGLRTAARVQGNLLDAHVAAYRALKTAHEQLIQDHPGMIAPSIGLLKNIHQLDPSPTVSGKWWMQRARTKATCWAGNYLQHEAIYRFFREGLYRVPFLGINHRNDAAPHTLDFVGLNYYSNCHVDCGKKLRETDERYATQSHNYRIYPEGLYRALIELWNQLVRHLDRVRVPLTTPAASSPSTRGGFHMRVPIYVTENGIATDDEEKRAQFYPAYLEQLHRAQMEIQAQGGSVLGYLPWTLMNNYEWPSVKQYHHHDYGLFNIDPQDPARLLLKPGARSYFDIVHGFASGASHE